MTWRRAAWALPVALFLATFGVFSVRHPGSVKAMLSSGQGVATTVAALAVAGVVVLAATKSPAVARVAPFVLAAGVLGAAVYAEVPFERRSTQNRRLVSGAVVARSEGGPIPAATRHATGTLKGINHSASGDVSIIESASGEWVIRFEDFIVQGSPAPVLYVVEGEDRRNPGGTNLGPFTATDGDTLDVALPEGVQPGAGWTVLIWCEKFVTPIANATQK